MKLPAFTETTDEAPKPTDEAPKSSNEKMVKIRIMRDRWDELGNRQEKGRVMDMPLDETVLEGIEKGTMERYKGSDNE